MQWISIHYHRGDVAQRLTTLDLPGWYRLWSFIFFSIDIVLDVYFIILRRSNQRRSYDGRTGVFVSWLVQEYWVWKDRYFLLSFMLCLSKSKIGVFGIGYLVPPMF